jgi:hypothetical protein
VAGKIVTLLGQYLAKHHITARTPLDAARIIGVALFKIRFQHL